MAALCNRAGHYIFALWFFLSSFFFFSLLSLDVAYCVRQTSTGPSSANQHTVWRSLVCRCGATNMEQSANPVARLRTNTQRVRSRSEDRRARPGGGSSSSVAPMTTAGSLSATADGPREADPTARRRCGGHKTPHSVTSHRLRHAARHFGPFPAS